MSVFAKSVQLFTTTTLALALAACGDDGSSSTSDDGTSIGINDPSTGQLSVGLTDAPNPEFESVNIAITAVELKPADGPSITIAVPADEYINLLDLQGGKVLELLDDYELLAGEYNWIRLYLADGNFAPELNLVGGGNFVLEIPSADQTGLKLNRPFTVTAGGSADFTIDFDAAKSVIQTGNGTYKLRPTLRVVDNTEVGSISGSVTTDLIGCAINDNYGRVYVFEGADVTPDDLDDDAAEPLVVAPVALDSDSNTGYSYTAAFLPAGTYTIAYTQDFDAYYGFDGNPQDDSLTFTNTQNVEVDANEAETVDLDLEINITSGGTFSPQC